MHSKETDESTGIDGAAQTLLLQELTARRGLPMGLLDFANTQLTKRTVDSLLYPAASSHLVSQPRDMAASLSVLYRRLVKDLAEPGGAEDGGTGSTRRSDLARASREIRRALDESVSPDAGPGMLVLLSAGLRVAVCDVPPAREDLAARVIALSAALACHWEVCEASQPSATRPRQSPATATKAPSSADASGVDLVRMAHDRLMNALTEREDLPVAVLEFCANAPDKGAELLSRAGEHELAKFNENTGAMGLFLFQAMKECRSLLQSDEGELSGVYLALLSDEKLIEDLAAVRFTRGAAPGVTAILSTALRVSVLDVPQGQEDLAARVASSGAFLAAAWGLHVTSTEYGRDTGNQAPPIPAHTARRPESPDAHALPGQVLIAISEEDVRDARLRLAVWNSVIGVNLVLAVACFVALGVAGVLFAPFFALAAGFGHRQAKDCRFLLAREREHDRYLKAKYRS